MTEVSFLGELFLQTYQAEELFFYIKSQCNKLRKADEDEDLNAGLFYKVTPKTENRTRRTKPGGSERQRQPLHV